MQTSVIIENGIDRRRMTTQRYTWSKGKKGFSSSWIIQVFYSVYFGTWHTLSVRILVAVKTVFKKLNKKALFKEESSTGIMKYTIYLSSLWSQMTVRGLHNHEVWKLYILRKKMQEAVEGDDMP